MHISTRAASIVWEMWPPFLLLLLLQPAMLMCDATATNLRRANTAPEPLNLSDVPLLVSVALDTQQIMFVLLFITVIVSVVVKGAKKRGRGLLSIKPAWDPRMKVTTRGSRFVAECKFRVPAGTYGCVPGAHGMFYLTKFKSRKTRHKAHQVGDSLKAMCQVIFDNEWSTIPCTRSAIAEYSAVAGSPAASNATVVNMQGTAWASRSTPNSTPGGRGAKRAR